jgi:hypothetical protein
MNLAIDPGISSAVALLDHFTIYLPVHCQHGRRALVRAGLDLYSFLDLLAGRAIEHVFTERLQYGRVGV